MPVLNAFWVLFQSVFRCGPKGVKEFVQKCVLAHILHASRALLLCDGTSLLAGGEVKGKQEYEVGSQ